MSDNISCSHSWQKTLMQRGTTWTEKIHQAKTLPEPSFNQTVGSGDSVGVEGWGGWRYQVGVHTILGNIEILSDFSKKSGCVLYLGVYYTWGRIILGGVLYLGPYYTWGRIILGGVLYLGPYYTWGRIIFGGVLYLGVYYTWGCIIHGKLQYVFNRHQRLIQNAVNFKSKI